MRPVLALVALAALAACTVDTEGAACRVPGAATDCPDEQACGTGLTCSTRAASCAPCTAGAVACRAGDLQECSTSADPVCGTWIVKTACAAGVTTCGTPLAGGPLECRCDRFVVDPAGFTAGTPCRFEAVATAIAEARRYGIAEVRLGGAAGQTYGLAAADAAPLIIPQDMAVVGDDSPFAPASRVLEVQGAASEAVRLDRGATLAGVTVRRGAGGSATGVRVVGASPSGVASLQAVRVDAVGAAFATGVRVEGAGAVMLDGLDVRGTSSVGLVVARDDVRQLVSASELVIDGEAQAAGAGVGVSLEAGDLTLTQPVVKRHAGAGVVATGAEGNVRLAIRGGSLHDNFGTGLVAQLLERLAITDTLICRNKGGTTRNINGSMRLVGGVFAAGAAPGEQEFTGNRVFDNDGDQLAIGLGSGTWNLDGPSGVGLACGPGANAFAGYAAGAYGLVAAGNASARFNGWPSGIPAFNVDVLKVGSPSVMLGTEAGGSDYCALPAGLDCPVP